MGRGQSLGYCQETHAAPSRILISSKTCRQYSVRRISHDRHSTVYVCHFGRTAQCQPAQGQWSRRSGQELASKHALIDPQEPDTGGTRIQSAGRGEESGSMQNLH